MDFYSHASCEARHIEFVILYGLGLFLLTRLLRGATFLLVLDTYAGHFYSHASCEARLIFFIAASLSNLFLLTRLLRGATRHHYKL